MRQRVFVTTGLVVAVSCGSQQVQRKCLPFNYETLHAYAPDVTAQRTLRDLQRCGWDGSTLDSGARDRLRRAFREARNDSAAVEGLLGELGRVAPGPNGPSTARPETVSVPGRVAIPATGPGGFQMGCTEDVKCDDDEKPVHRVVLSAFSMAATETTVEEYARVSKTMPPAPSFNPDWSKRDHPIVNVTWDEAKAYCKAVGGDLPTEAQWEWAASGGARRATYGPLDQVAWYDKNSGGSTHPAGKLAPNKFGLYDMLGNVWEWTNEWFDSSYYGNSPAENPKGPASGPGRAVRGGSWDSLAAKARVSHRNHGLPGSRDSRQGFRCVWQRMRLVFIK